MCVFLIEMKYSDGPNKEQSGRCVKQPPVLDSKTCDELQQAAQYMWASSLECIRRTYAGAFDSAMLMRISEVRVDLVFSSFRINNFVVNIIDC